MSDEKRVTTIGRGRGILTRLDPSRHKPSESPETPNGACTNVTSIASPSAPTTSALSSLSIGRGRSLAARIQPIVRPGAEARPVILGPASDMTPAGVSIIGRGKGLLISAAASKLTSSSSQSTFEPPATSTLDSTIQQMSKVSISTEKTKSYSEIKDTPPVVRTGTKGSQFEAAVNYIRLDIEPGKGVYEHEVKFNPPIDFRGVCHRLVKEQHAILGRTNTFDGTMLYLPYKLPDPVLVINTKHPTAGTPVEIKIIYKRTKRMSEVKQLYNVLFKRIMGELNLVRFGRQHFDPKAPHLIPQHKLEVWPGFVTAVDEFEGGLFLSIDSSHRVLRTESVLEFIRTVISADKYNYQDNIKQSLLGNSVMTRYNNKLYRVDDILFQENPMKTFKLKSNEEISFVKYYKDQYDIDIMDVEQPLILNRSSAYVSGEEKPVERQVILIPELCNLTGLSESMTSNFNLMKDVAQYTRITPNQRVFALKKFIDNVKKCEPARRMLADWGLSLSDDPLRLAGRTLEPETIVFGGDRSGRPNRVSAGPKADWGRESTSNPVIEAVNLRDWVILFSPKDSNRANDLVETLRRCGPPMGINVDVPQRAKVESERNTEWASALKSVIRSGLQFVLCLCPTRRDDRYSLIKKICCVDNPIPSQVVNSYTLGNPKRLRSIVQKIALQINCKLGGILWSIPLPFKSGIMVCGIDSYHDAKCKSQSVCALTASFDMNLTRYFSRVAFQKQGQEVVDCLKSCFGDALAHFISVNRCWPSRVVMFRDGVGDGQLDACRNYEAVQMEEVLRTRAGGEQSQLTYIVVQKRINTRVFATSGRGDVANPPPGSIVDHTVTRRDWYDFFMVSQHVTQGTVTPTHYIVVRDPSNSKPDNIQRLTYMLCHMYYNWPGTVRVPAPCQYAHKLAYLIGCSVHHEHDRSLSDKLFFL